MQKLISSFPGKAICLILFLVATHVVYSQNISSKLNNGFIQPPDSIKTSVYWYWMNGNISKEGVIKDLEAMKRVGINRAFIGNIGYDLIPEGTVRIFSDEWWDILHTALKTATRLNIEIGIFNSPGWSQSGGPWIPPAHSMRYLASSQLTVNGGRMISDKMDAPDTFFQDVKVLAFPTHAASEYELVRTDVEIPLDSVETIAVDIDSEFVARSIVLNCSKRPLIVEIDFQVKQGDQYRSVKKFSIDRSNDILIVGFNRYGPVAVSIPETKGKSFRLVIGHRRAKYVDAWWAKPPPSAGITSIKICSGPVVDNYVDKSLGKMSQSPFPLWNHYLWPNSESEYSSALYTDPSAVLDISRYMDTCGKLKWNAPPGKWTILRTGMAPTGVNNSPAPAGGRGLEVDKLNKAYLNNHFNSFLGEIMRRIPTHDRKTWKVVVEDSYEVGSQNWTDDMFTKFKSSFGYDPTPFIPVLSGYVVGSKEMSDRFLWDLRRFVADQIAYEYVGGLKNISNKNGFTTWLENYGHWGFPGEFLQYGGQSDEVAGEFWVEGVLGNMENRAAASCAHIYGKNKVSSESFTCGGAAFSRMPNVLKARGDRFFAEGVNNTLLHVFIHQPYENRNPGINADFGNEFNRKNTWFNYLDLFTTYLKRCNYMLQYGRYEADVAYFIGEDVPKMTGVTEPPLPQGYSFDYINAEVIKRDLKVVNGKLVLPNGINYRLLVLPKLTTMRPEVLERLEQLVKQGAVIYGPPPVSSPSLQNFPACDEEVKRISSKLWKDSVTVNHYGKGIVITGLSLEATFQLTNHQPDFKCSVDSILFLHRKANNEDIYFISNQKNQAVKIEPSFRLMGKAPELFDPVLGEIKMLRNFSVHKSNTIVPLTFEPYQSYFVVFRKPAVQSESNLKENFPPVHSIQVINNPWTVTFDSVTYNGPGQPVTYNELQDWTKSSNERIRYYSGEAIYLNTFDNSGAADSFKVFIDVGHFNGMAKVKINGRYAGGIWTYPYHLDITKLIKAGENIIEITVANNWMNRMIGDLLLAPEHRKTWQVWNPYTADSPLQSSGLKGPVLLKYYKRN